MTIGDPTSHVVIYKDLIYSLMPQEVAVLNLTAPRLDILPYHAEI